MNRALDGALAARAKRVMGHVAPVLTGARRVLDVGSGTGHNGAWLRRLGCEVVEVDVVDMRGTGTPMPAPMLFDGLHLPFPKGSFDAATMCFVLHYAQDPVRLLREALRVARRVVLLQSTYGRTLPGVGGRASLAALGLRDAVMGRWALRATNALGYTNAPPQVSLMPRSFFGRDALLRLVAEAGGTMQHHRPGRPTFAGLRRELLVVRPKETP